MDGGGSCVLEKKWTPGRYNMVKGVHVFTGNAFDIPLACLQRFAPNKRYLPNLRWEMSSFA